MATSKNSKAVFKVNENVVYPSHGVGKITAIEKQDIAGISLELYVVSFEQDKMILRVPLNKAESSGMRKLADEDMCKKTMTVLKGRARIKRTMWSRRAQEYEAKINSGDIISVAEVVRDLYRLDTQPDQSYSERQLYEAALERLAREIAAINQTTHTEAVSVIEQTMAKSPKRKKAVEAAEQAAQELEDANKATKAA